LTLFLILKYMFNWFKKSENAGDPLEALVDNLIKEVKLNDLPEADYNFLKESLIMQINRRLGSIIMENLNDEGLAEYNELLNEGLIPDAGKLEKLLEKYIPDYEEKVKTGLDEFIKEAAQSLSSK